MAYRHWVKSFSLSTFLQSPFFGKNLELVEGLARRLDPRRSDITRRYRTCVGRARCLVMSKTRAFRTSFLRLAEAISVLARASFNYSIFTGSAATVEDKGIEPLTLGLQSQCSPAELIPQDLAACGLARCAGEPPGPPSRPLPDRALKTK